MEYSPNILIVDDDEFNRDSIDFILQSAHFHVVTAKNESDAKKKIEKAEACCQTFQMVIVDLQMPVSRGLALLEELYAFKSYYSLLAISTYNTPQVVSKLRRRSRVTFMDKPFNDQQLIQTVLRGLPDDQNVQIEPRHRNQTNS
ncbi:MAG TPA: response regulator [bacterium]|jgi:DNA-binding NtrC family response regulator|nr:response regulator [bacterium]HNT65244.1 response regulator [bacterium]HOX86953.1 response regulator [bacterium]HPG46284.1 response regulator [bacterium]HPM98522.1 response regulator [bacterium]